MNLFEFDERFFKDGCRVLCGIDEAGRGPLAGPVVAAAVAFEKATLIKGVRDSKQLTAVRREALFPEIIHKALAVGIGIVSPKTIDRINILAATHLAAKKALRKLSILPDLIITDYLKLKNTPAPLLFFVKGDRKSQAIAAASIMAKVTRDRLMVHYHARFPQYNFAKNKGYGTREHLTAIKKWGPSKIHRLTFRGVAQQSML